MYYKILFIITLIIHPFQASLSQNFWEQTNGPYGGVITSLDINTEGDIYAGSYLGGVFRSIDDGETWEQVGLTDRFIHSLAIHPNGDILASVAGGIFRSTNSDTTWEQILDLDTPVEIICINANGDIFAGSYLYDVSNMNDGRLFRSIDNGKSWTRVETGLRGVGVSSILVHSDGSIYVGTWTEVPDQVAGVYRSTDKGDTWVQTSLKGTSVLSFIEDLEGNIFAGTGKGAFRSSDAGTTWVRISSGLGGEIPLSLVNISDGTVFAGTPGGVFMLSDTTWGAVNNGLPEKYIEALVTNSEDHIFATPYGHGIYRSTNKGQDWKQKNEGVINTGITSLATNSLGEVFAGEGTLGVFRSSNNGETWVQTNLTDASVHSITIDPDNVIFVGCSGYKGALRSRDFGVSWTTLGLTHTIVSSIVIDSGGRIFAGTFHGLYRSTDRGDSWNQLAFADTVVRPVTVDSKDNIFVIVGRHGLFRSADSGDTWTQIDLWESRSYIASVVVDSSGYIYVGTVYDGGVFRSEDNGESWSQTGLSDSNLVVSGFVLDEKANIWANTSHGVYVSSDKGDTWIEKNKGLTITNVNAMTINSDGYIFAGTGGRGVFRSVEQLATLGSWYVTFPESCELNEPYPNPFNPTTTIEFSIPQSGIVTLNVYDLLGRKVETILNKPMIADHHKVLWNASNIPSGIYFIKMQSGTFSQVRKGMVVR